MRRALTVIASLSLSLSVGCLTTEPTQPTNEDSSAKSEGGAAKAQPHEPIAAKPTDPASPPGPTADPEPGSNVRPGEPPKWYDEALFEGAKVMRKDTSETELAGGFASAMVLELPAGTTAATCMTDALAQIAKDLGKGPDDMPNVDINAGNDRHTVHGSGDGYEYTVVCGDAKGKPTMYLSYTRS